MSDTPPSQVLPEWVDARKLAFRGAALEGEVSLRQLPRVVDAVASVDEESVWASLQFSQDEQRHWIITGDLTTEVSVICQRCLEPMPLPVVTQVAIAVVGSEEEARQLPKALEPWMLDAEEGAKGNLYQLIEDELLLGLPMVAYHEHQCIDSSLYTSTSNDADGRTVEREENPFQILEKLKNSSHNGNKSGQ